MMTFLVDPSGALEVRAGGGLVALLTPTSTGFTLKRREALVANVPSNPLDQPQTITAPERIEIMLLPPTGIDLL